MDFNASRAVLEGRWRTLGFDALLPEERAFIVLWWLEAEVFNGGFHQYFFNSAGDAAPEALVALKSLGAVQTARVLADAIDLLGGPCLTFATMNTVASTSGLSSENGFSWEWFDRGQGDVFQKLQGDGRVSVRTKKGPGYEELESVEFLDDIVLRYLDDMAKPPGTHTHEVLVRKGSVLKLAP